MLEQLLSELSHPGRSAASLPETDVPATPLPHGFLRDDLPLPELSELEVVRHYTHLSHLNFTVDIGFYPLGSCTMKYNPKVDDVAASLPGFVNLHPLQPAESTQGAMALMLNLQRLLSEIGGFAATSLLPAAGAQGELTGILMMRKYLYDRGETQRNLVLVPDSAHGTNPATTAMSGLKVMQIPSDLRGNVDLEALRTLVAEHGSRLIGLMLTNPNTLGLFDEHLREVLALVHDAGGLVYGDGANLNALLGKVKPGEMGFDVMHFNLHKTFATPHGGGGPGAGTVSASAALADYLPGPIVGEADGTLQWVMPAHSIGRMKSFYGNFSVLVHAYTYIRMLGADGLRAVSENAVLNANYLQARVKEILPVPYGDRLCMHEFVAQGNIPGAPGVHTLDIAKRIIDFGMHPPTIYFPLIVPEALMIEPTETEDKETLDYFADTLAKIAEEARTNPDLLHTAPHNAPLHRLDEVKAARSPKLCDTGCTPTTHAPERKEDGRRAA